MDNNEQSYEYRTILVQRTPFFTEFAKEIAKKINSDDSDNIETCKQFGYDLQGLLKTLDSPLTDEERNWYEGLAISLAKFAQ
tara:strand:+ start:325 stop:570 length:246 start_codon:yes stop_codon:yes gene_type:complete